MEAEAMTAQSKPVRSVWPPKRGGLLPKGSPVGTRRLSKPRKCCCSDMDRATRKFIPPCKRPAWFTAPDIFPGSPGRAAFCKQHLTGPARCYALLAKPVGGRHRCRRIVKAPPWRCEQHPADKELI